MYIHERHPQIWNVDLVVFSTVVESTSLRDALLFTGYGIFPDSNHETEALLQSFKNDETKLIKSTDGWKENGTFEITVSHIADPENIYVQKVTNCVRFHFHFLLSSIFLVGC